LSNDFVKNVLHKLQVSDTLFVYKLFVTPSVVKVLV